MAYLTESDLENYILEDIDPSFSGWITSVIAAVTSYIEKYTGIDFDGNNSASDRYFDGDGEDRLYIGPFQSGASSVYLLDSVGNVIETLTLNTDYWEIPYNETMKTGIQLAPGGKRLHFPCGIRTVKVTAKFGYATIPDDVKQAAIRLAAKIVNEGIKGGQVSSESLGAYSVSYQKVDEMAEAIGILNTLDHYRPITLV